MDQLTRRDFVKTSASATAASTLGFNVTNYAGSPNGTVRVAVVGLKDRGRAHTQGLLAVPNVEIAALCDVDDAQFDYHVKAVAEKGKTKPKLYKDIRKLLEDKEIDAISIATPNHWHSLMAIWACQAGKDVYCEKPMSHTLWEGRKLVEAARKHNRIVQHGSQSRSKPSIIEAMQHLREGLIGDVYMARGLCYKWRDTIGKKPDSPVPAGVDYDLWTGPAPQRPFNENRFHYKWHWNWDYGNGDIGNQGAHEMDVARWGLGVTSPTKVSSLGGHFMFDDDQVTPNTQIASFEFDKNGKKVILVFEVRHWMTNREAGIGAGRDSNCVGDIFYGSKGYLVTANDGSYRSYLGKDQQPGPKSSQSATNDSAHFANFIQAMHTRKASDLNADIEQGHLSCSLIHLANISYRLGRTVNFDAKTETIMGDKQASAMLKHNYRAPFVVPEKV